MQLLTKISLLLLAFVAGGFTSSVVFNEINRQTVGSASKLIAMEYTATEIDSMLDGLSDLREQYTKMRADTLTNDLAPALVFNPIPPGMDFSGQQKPIVYSDTKVEMPKDKQQLAFMTVGELAYLLKNRKISSLELTQFFLDRLKKYNDTLHCVISFTEKLALEQAKRADREIARGQYRGPLHGIPYGAKDLLAAKNYLTTWGAMPYKDQKFDYDATVVKKLEEAGAVLVAKLTLGALAWGDVWFGGMTRNPWDPSKGSSGSSAGSASAVSAGLLPFAIGTETLGSIVSPSTVCGTTGLRPTFGRVSRHGAMALSWSMDKIGPICRSAEDCAMVFAAIYGTDGKDFHLYEAPFNYDARFNPKRLKVGYLKSAFDRTYAFKAQDSLSLEKLKNLGFDLIPIELPAMPNIRFILEAEAAAAFDDLTRSNRDDLMVRQIRNAWPNVFRQARFIPAVEYINANRLRTRLIQDMAKVFEQVDAYVNPSWGSPSLTITNFTGHPCVVLPNGFRNGTPTSITFTGKLFGEAELLSLAKAYQDATEFHKMHPELPDK